MSLAAFRGTCPSGTREVRPRPSTTTSQASTSVPRSCAVVASVVVPAGIATPCSRGSPFADSFRAIVAGESVEKSERHRRRETASAGSPSTVGESTAVPLPGVVALARTTG